MELISQFIDLVLHLDQHLTVLAQTYGVWIYALLFLIVFCETGLVVTPFLPGDSLLFVGGTVAAAGDMNAHWLAGLLMLASFCGDSTNYAVGRFLGPRLFKQNSRLLKAEYLDRANAFYERHGGKTILLARFIPIVRTYAPFVAGIGHMPYRRFVGYSVLGAISWAGGLTYAGYFFGSLSWVKENLTLVLVGIVLLSLAPAIIEFLRGRLRGTPPAAPSDSR